MNFDNRGYMDIAPGAPDRDTGLVAKMTYRGKEPRVWPSGNIDIRPGAANEEICKLRPRPLMR